MIPLYVGDQPIRGPQGLPQKNPIYFIRKALGKEPAETYSILVLNTDSSFPADLIPPDITIAHSQPAGDAYDVESVEVARIEDSSVEPYALRDGSSAGEPRTSSAVISLNGFVRGSSYADLQKKVSYLNYAFDPFNNYLEGASVFDNTIATRWQTFESVGFGVLAWHQPSHGDFRGTTHSEWEGTGLVSPYAVEEYARLNRFVFARTMNKPIPLNTKFGDMNVPFIVQLLMVDPAIYEFISPQVWWSQVLEPSQASPWFLDESSNGRSIEPSDWPGVTVVSNEVFVTPSYPWHFRGPGYREVYTSTFTEV